MPKEGEARRTSAPEARGRQRVDASTVIIVIAVLLMLLVIAHAVYEAVTGIEVTLLVTPLVLAFLGVALFAAYRTRETMRRLADTARSVAEGDLTARVDLGGRGELADLGEAFNSMAATIEQRTDDLTHKLTELTSLYEMSRALSSTLDLDTLLGSTLEAALRSFSVGSGYVVLRDPVSGEFRLRAWRGVADAHPDARAMRQSMSDWVVQQGRPLIFNPPELRNAAANIDSITGARAAVCVPLHASEGVIGAIAVGTRDTDARFNGDDVRLLSTIANHLAVAIGNTELFGSLQEAYLATVRSLAAAVDAKEPYMRGHSERVAVFARAIADEMRLSIDQRTALEMAAYLHDIGKIGIAGSILRKPGPLDEAETITIRHHPLIGANILRPVAFPWAIAPVVRHHHEHFDGSGYPAGLRGDEIPMLARVLCVADAYEAMTADRPYRTSLSGDGALDELRRCAGTHFDPRVVDALVAVLEDADTGARPSERPGIDVDPYEARAVCVAIVDGMIDSYRRLGGPRLTSNLESEMGDWLAVEEPAFRLAAGHLSADWELVGGGEVALNAMRRVIRHLAGLMGEMTGRNLVDRFYEEAVGTLTERLRESAAKLRLYSAA